MKKTIGIILVGIIFCSFYEILIHFGEYLVAIQILGISVIMLALATLVGWLFYDDND